MIDFTDYLYNEVKENIHTSYMVVDEGGGTIYVSKYVEEISNMNGCPGCMIVDFHQGKATMLYIDEDLNHHDHFIGDQGFTITIENNDGKITINLYRDENHLDTQVTTSLATFEQDIENIWTEYKFEACLKYYESYL